MIPLKTLRNTFFLTCLLPINVFAGVNKCLINGETVYTSKKCPENTIQTFEIEASPENLSLNINETAYHSRKWYNDHTGYKKALTISISRKAPLFIYGRTDWCPYCKKFDNTFLSNREVKQALSRFVKLKLNPEHSAEDKKLFNSWGGTGYPSLFVQSWQGSQPKKIKIPFIKQGNNWKTTSKEAFISTLQKQLEK